MAAIWCRRATSSTPAPKSRITATASNIALAAGAGPLTSGLIFDWFGSYHNLFLVILPMTTTSATLIGTLGAYPATLEPEEQT